jgi:sulfur relay (sulfurtransferase) complex TusBCD TusD component (DsrE family)
MKLQQHHAEFDIGIFLMADAVTAAAMGSMSELAQWFVEADKVLSF